MFTNAETYLAIAKAALLASQTESARRTRNSDGAVIVEYDREQSSFKQSLIAIVFAAVYLESLLYREGRRRLGQAYRDGASYEAKVNALGIVDEEVLAGCERLRNVRKGIVHEKAAAAADVGKFVPAQQEAAAAVALVERISVLLGPSGNDAA